MIDMHRVEELIEDAGETDSIEELRQIVRDMAEEVRQAKRFSSGEELAAAVYAFADWHYGGYGSQDSSTQRVVGRQLWFEVSDRVRKITGSSPAAPSLGAEGTDS